MGFHSVAFLPSQANLYSTFHKNCCKGECLKAVVWGKQILLLQQILFLYQSLFMEIIKLSQSGDKSGQPQFWGCCWIPNRGVYLSIHCLK